MRLRTVGFLPIVAAFLAFGPGCIAATDSQESDEGGQSVDPSAGGEEQTESRDDAVCSCAVYKYCTHQLTVYENSDCCGGNFFFCPGDYPDLRQFGNNLGWGANWNDRISIVSTWADSHVQAWVYQHTNFGGDVKYIAPNQWKDLGPTLWNDQISSIKVRYKP